MTPLHLLILLHYYTTVGNYAEGTAHGNSAATKEYSDQLYRWNLLAYTNIPEQTYKITDRGRAFVCGLLQMPIPIYTRSIPNHPEIKLEGI
jgi:hypothetical protein